MEAACLLLVIALLPGCLYPGEDGPPAKAAYRDSVRTVQSALDDYYAEEGVLPIKTAGQETPDYEKFVIDLDLLRNKGYLDRIPAAAFEEGGSVYFLAVHEETDPAVKVMDLPTMQRTNDVQLAVSRYKAAHDGELPDAGEIYPGLYRVDLKEAGLQRTTLASVYSGEELDWMMDRTGNVYVDYALDIRSALDRSGTVPGEAEDLRAYLVRDSWFSPVKSLPYYWRDGQPVPRPITE